MPAAYALGKAAPAANTYTGVYTADAIRTVNIKCINRDITAALALRLAACPAGWAGGAPANADYLEGVDQVIPPGGQIENTAVVLAPGEVVVASANTNALTVRVMGF